MFDWRFISITAAVVFITAILENTFPPLTAVVMAFCVGYWMLRRSEMYAQNFNLLMFATIGLFILNTASGPFGLLSLFYGPAMSTLGDIGLVLGSLKIILAIPGESIKGKLVSTNGATAAAANQSLWTAVTSVLNPQAVIVFVGALVAIVPLVFFDLLLNWGPRAWLREVFLVLGTVSLALVAMALDIKDKMIYLAGKVKQALSESEGVSPEVESAEANGPEVFFTESRALEIYAQLEEELPTVTESDWDPDQIQSLSPAELRAACFESAEKDFEQEDGVVETFESESLFGEVGVVRLPTESMLVLTLPSQSQSQAHDEELFQAIDNIMQRLNTEIGLIQLCVGDDVDQDVQFELLRQHGILISDSEWLCREFEDTGVKQNNVYIGT